MNHQLDVRESTPPWMGILLIAALVFATLSAVVLAWIEGRLN